MALVSGVNFIKSPEQFAAAVTRDIERLYQKVNGGSNDGNAASAPVTQTNSQVTNINVAQQETINLTFPGGNTVQINASDFAGLVGAQVKLRIVRVCDSGTEYNMLVLGSQTFPV